MSIAGWEAFWAFMSSIIWVFALLFLALFRIDRITDMIEDYKRYKKNEKERRNDD